MNIAERFKAPTPKFFRFVRNIGALLTALSCVVLSEPVELAPFIESLASYLTVAGAVAAGVSQTAVASDSAEAMQDSYPGGGAAADEIRKGLSDVFRK